MNTHAVLASFWHNARSGIFWHNANIKKINPFSAGHALCYSLLLNRWVFVWFKCLKTWNSKEPTVPLRERSGFVTFQGYPNIRKNSFFFWCIIAGWFITHKSIRLIPFEPPLSYIRHITNGTQTLSTDCWSFALVCQKWKSRIHCSICWVHELLLCLLFLEN